jgi:hypothetical protein
LEVVNATTGDDRLQVCALCGLFFMYCRYEDPKALSCANRILTIENAERLVSDLLVADALFHNIKALDETIDYVDSCLASTLYTEIDPLTDSIVSEMKILRELAKLRLYLHESSASEIFQRSIGTELSHRFILFLAEVLTEDSMAPSAEDIHLYQLCWGYLVALKQYHGTDFAEWISSLERKLVET